MNLLSDKFENHRVIILIFAVLIMVGFAFSQSDPIGGPYTPDSATVLLMHFDGDLSNVSQFSADGQFIGDSSNFFFLNNPFDPALGQVLRIDNDSQSDSAYVIVPDTSSLDLTGDWTIEGWINIFTFGEGPGDWRWVPRLVIKTGDEVFWRPNYFVEMWGSSRFFSAGYHTASQDAWPQANSPDNTMVPGEWYHLAFIRDTSRHILLTLIHNANRELIAFSVADYLTFGAQDPTPITTNQPLHIGYAGGGGDSFLDGFVDEIRISNVVREFPTPPIITKVTQLGNQPTSVQSYDVGANIFTLFSTTIQSADLFYSLDGGANFTSVPMTPAGGDSFVASIPQQPLGSIITYYVKATDNQGLSYTQPQTAETDSVYYRFGIYTPNTLALALPFEEGSGIPVDTSAYANPVTPVGNPTYSTNAAVGNYSIYLEGDSSYLEVDSPFLAAEEFNVDFWFNADTFRTYTRILNRPANPNTWYENNYQIRVNPNNRLFVASDGSVSMELDVTLEEGKWYRVIYEVQKAPPGDTTNYYAIVQLRDENDQLLQQKYAAFDNKPIQAMAPLRIGKSTDGDYPPYFKGYIDNVHIYNFPAAGLSPSNVTAINDELQANLPFKYELLQNYPNPFNPSTEIKFSVARNEKVKIIVYDILGRKVKTLLDKKLTAGKYSVTWDGTNYLNQKVTSGVYFYRLESEHFVKTRKMLFVK